MENRTVKAFDFAADVVKQFLTLAIAIITFTTTFSVEAAPGKVTYPAMLLYLAWAFYCLSIFSGLFALAKMATLLEPAYGVKSPSIYGGIATRAAFTQIVLFTAGIVCMLLFGYLRHI